ncbi:hypothetical protein [Burkholderia contaminans]|uniref:hypothetical protein n=1 Tax=Burkholderia contaminans TaxID=488447 RepID=UPI00158D07D3|nr:hypothetical protein [Burkholderia contaminans]
MKPLVLPPRSLPFLLLIFATPTWADSVAKSDQVVIVMDYGSLDLTRLHQLEDELDVIVKQTHSGKLDGDEVTLDGRKASIYMKSVDTDRLIKAIRPALKTHDFSRDAHVSLSD